MNEPILSPEAEEFASICPRWRSSLEVSAQRLEPYRVGRPHGAPTKQASKIRVLGRGDGPR